MIWGKTYKEVSDTRNKKDANWFAWYPVHLKDGRWCWLTRIKRTMYLWWDGKKKLYYGSWYEYTIKELLSKQ